MLSRPELWTKVEKSPDAELWEVHQVLKSRLLTFVRRRLADRRQRLGRPAPGREPLLPDARLEIFQVTALGLNPMASVPVGLEPVAVNARTDSEVWVVNHLSDSVSIVDVAANPPRVVRTLLVGDEPRDVVFAGPRQSRAFVTAARRGQNHPDDTANETQVEGLGRADVWVFDAENLGESLRNEEIGIITLFGDKPGSMGVSQDGKVIGRFRATGVRPKVCERLKASGIHLPADMFEGVTEVR